MGFILKQLSRGNERRITDCRQTKSFIVVLFVCLSVIVNRSSPLFGHLGGCCFATRPIDVCTGFYYLKKCLSIKTKLQDFVLTRNKLQLDILNCIL